MRQRKRLRGCAKACKRVGPDLGFKARHVCVARLLVRGPVRGDGLEDVVDSVDHLPSRESASNANFCTNQNAPKQFSTHLMLLGVGVPVRVVGTCQPTSRGKHGGRCLAGGSDDALGQGGEHILCNIQSSKRSDFSPPKEMLRSLAAKAIVALAAVSLCEGFLAPSPAVNLLRVSPAAGLVPRQRRVVAGRLCMAGGLEKRRPQPGELGASALIQYLWNEAQYFPDYPECSIPFFADDVSAKEDTPPHPLLHQPTHCISLVCPLCPYRWSTRT